MKQFLPALLVLALISCSPTDEISHKEEKVLPVDSSRFSKLSILFKEFNIRSFFEVFNSTSFFISYLNSSLFAHRIISGCIVNIKHNRVFGSVAHIFSVFSTRFPFGIS